MKLLNTVTAALLASVVSGASIEKRANYDGYRVYRVPVGDDVDRINHVASQLHLETWKAASAGGFADFAVRPDQIDAFQEALGDLKPSVMHHDLGVSIAQESSAGGTHGGSKATDGSRAAKAAAAAPAKSTRDSWFNSYHSWSDHIKFLNDLQKQHPANAALVSSGVSAEGHNITGLHLFGKHGAGHNPAIVLHGTVHAREWITTMAVEYIAHALLAGYGSDVNLTRNLDTFDFYLFPVVNVDGFLHTQTTDRMWRKNRQKNPGTSCVGRDLNRNWDYKWDIPNGASEDPCDQSYRGQKAGDSPEFQALAGFLHKVKKAQGIKMYMDFHSYSQLLMTPYSYSCTVFPENNNEYLTLANGTVAAIQSVHGTVFTAGPICPTIYAASGGSVDYVLDVVKADYAFAIELRDEGEFGFVLPPEQILPSGEETLAGLRYLMDHVK